MLSSLSDSSDELRRHETGECFDVLIGETLGLLAFAMLLVCSLSSVCDLVFSDDEEAICSLAVSITEGIGLVDSDIEIVLTGIQNRTICCVCTFEFLDCEN